MKGAVGGWEDAFMADAPPKLRATVGNRSSPDGVRSASGKRRWGRFRSNGVGTECRTFRPLHLLGLRRGPTLDKWVRRALGRFLLWRTTQFGGGTVRGRPGAEGLAHRKGRVFLHRTALTKGGIRKLEVPT